jgi:hypothetical protein
VLTIRSCFQGTVVDTRPGLCFHPSICQFACLCITPATYKTLRLLACHMSFPSPSLSPPVTDVNDVDIICPYSNLIRGLRSNLYSSLSKSIQYLIRIRFISISPIYIYISIIKFGYLKYRYLFKSHPTQLHNIYIQIKNMKTNMVQALSVRIRFDYTLTRRDSL